LHGEFDVAIVDLSIPKMDGLEMIRQALADDMVNASMIVLTGYGEKKEVVKALNLGVEAWFDKSDDLDMSKLFKRVCELAEVVPIEEVRRWLSPLSEEECHKQLGK
jgi:CheY-like chemotaxis protein